MKSYKLVLWGTGIRTKMCMDDGLFSGHSIIGIIDTYKKTDVFYSIPVYSPDKLNELMEAADYLVILNQYYDEILRTCWESNVDIERIVITDNVRGLFFSDCFARLKDLSQELYQRMSVEEYRVMHPNLSDRIDETRLLGRGKYNSSTSMTDYMIDYFRYRTFEFAAREIKNQKIPGELAELGVFQGAFASLINETFPERKLYLFDTFESFDRKEFNQERAKGRCGDNDDFLTAHAKTSEEIMLSNIPNQESVIVCKGLFPESVPTAANDERFAFVSLDVDFEESTYQGLRFFYPRLSENGYIFLHDYTTHWLQGVREAVERYERDNHLILKKVPLADREGTLVIIK